MTPADGLLKRIAVEPGKCGGRPCVRGLRFRLTDHLDLLGAGADFDEILSDQPSLERDDILAALASTPRTTVAFWAFAAAEATAVVSKDEDFLHLAHADPSGPAFVWVRIGNCRTPALIAAFDRVLPALEAAPAAGQRIVEVR